jgi:ferredoxin
MVKTEIYYFSATGNSLFMARHLALKLNAKLTPIVPLLKGESVSTSADMVGLVFPIYGFKAPKMVNAFVKKIPDLDSKYVFAVATYGIAARKSLKELDKVLQLSGAKLSSGAAVRMPLNGIVTEKVSAEKLRKMENKAKAKLDKLCQFVAAQEAEKLESSNIVRSFALAGVLVKSLPRLLNLLGHVARHGWSSLGFVADKNCGGCGLCAEVCPMNNISLADSKPSWGKSCIMCCACLQWCPKQAIQAGTMTVNKPRYHHPDVQVSDIINQKQSAI